MSQALRRLLVACSALLLLAVPAAAIESHTGQVVEIDDSEVVVETESGTEKTIAWTADLTRPDNVESGDAVIVRFDADEASEILKIHEKLQVADSDQKRYHAIAGTLQEVNPDHMILETPAGQEAFVIYPDELFPPMPAEGKRVAVVYRETGTTSKYSQFAASEILTLDESFQIASDNVEVSYSDMEQKDTEQKDTEQEQMASEEPMTESQTETQVADTQATSSSQSADERSWEQTQETESSSADSSQSERTLPQTASHMPLIGLLGLLAALGWIALGVLRR